MVDNKVQIGIYKIENKHNIEDISTAIDEKGYTLQELKNSEIDGYMLKLYYRKNPSNPNWKRFLNHITKADQRILEGDKSWVEGFVLLLSNSTNGNIYAVTGGPGYFAIQESIYNDFGIDIFSRLIKKEDKVLKAAKEMSVVGGILGTTKHFRYNFNFFENESFGKIYQELKASLDKKILIEKLGFSEDDIKRESICVAKSSFKINKAIPFEQLIKIINGCETILQAEPSITINNVEKLDKKKKEPLIQKLDIALLSQLWGRYSEDPNFYDFDLCNKNFEEYLTAEKYIIRKGFSSKNFFGEYVFDNLNAIDILFKKIKESDKKPESESDFIELVKALRIFTYDEEGKDLTNGDFLSHLLGDVKLEGKRYFFIDKSWYQIKDSFIKQMNESCANFVIRNYYDGLEKEWDYPEENEEKYVQKYIGETNTVVLHKITPENIELCDMLKWDNNNLYLIHAKAAFGNKMRELSAQIIIAANRIAYDLNYEKKYVRKIYSTLKAQHGNSGYLGSVGKQIEHYSEADIINLFTDKKIVFVLGVLDTATNKTRNLRNIEDFESNIAKFSLQELIKDMRGLGVDFRINQIKRG